MSLSSSKHREMNPEAVKFDEGWMSPLNRIIWFGAFKARKTEVTIRDGRKFVLVYFRTKLSSNPNSIVGIDDYVKIDPAPGEVPAFVPCGTFRLKDVTSLNWVREGKAVSNV